MAAQVELRSDDTDDVARLSYHPADEDFGTLAVEVRAGGLAYDESVLVYRGDGLQEFFEGLAADWRGWDGTRTWDSIEHGMTIEATHRGSRVELLLVIRRDPTHPETALEVRLPLFVEPGESLSRVGKIGEQLFQPSDG